MKISLVFLTGWLRKWIFQVLYLPTGKELFHHLIRLLKPVLQELPILPGIKVLILVKNGVKDINHP